MMEVELPTFQCVSDSEDDDDGNGGFDQVGAQSSDDDNACRPAIL